MYLADAAVLAVGAAALVVLVRTGPVVLRPARSLFVASLAVLVWILLATLYGPAVTDGYRFATHAVTAAKYWEYALLALAVPVLARRPAERALLVATVVAWSVVATAFGLLQFFGLVNELEGRRPGQREPSFLGVHDFAALSGAALAVALACIAVGSLERGRDRAAIAAGAASGTIGLTLSGAAAGAIGAAAAAVAAALLAARRGSLSPGRLAALAGLTVTVALGAFAMRSVDFEPALRALGVDFERERPRDEGESYRQRSVLAYMVADGLLATPVKLSQTPGGVIRRSHSSPFPRPSTPGVCRTRSCRRLRSSAYPAYCSSWSCSCSRSSSRPAHSPALLRNRQCSRSCLSCGSA